MQINIIGQHVVAGHFCTVSFRKIVLHVLQLIAVADQHVMGRCNVSHPVIERMTGRLSEVRYGNICVLACAYTFCCTAIKSSVYTDSKTQMDFPFISSLVINSQRNTAVSRFKMCFTTGNIAIFKRTALRHIRHILESNVLAFHLDQIRVQLA